MRLFHPTSFSSQATHASNTHLSILLLAKT
jgi:hypothetical protein